MSRAIKLNELENQLAHHISLTAVDNSKPVIDLYFAKTWAATFALKKELLGAMGKVNRLNADASNWIRKPE